MTANQPKSHRRLVLWQKSIRLAAEIHQVSRRLPKHELFGLAAQMNRAAISIPSNVAEGAARHTTRDYMRFLYIARGSSAEIDTQLVLAEEMGYFTHDELAPVLAISDEVGRLLNAVITALHRRLNHQPPLTSNP
ncbi:MAG: four helix bundle protein [Steroidobacteraceae bacterium]|nr:four helix bundle protein [Steroidobacteraceae bacterium]